MSESKAIDEFLAVLEREHSTTMKVLRAFPKDKAEIQPHPKSKSARELAFVFAVENVLGQAVLQDKMMEVLQGGGFPSAPESWDEILDTVEKGHRDFAALVRSFSD